MIIQQLTEFPKTVYHGTTTEHIISIENIDTYHSDETFDFGRGFYTTSSKRQAIEWARRSAEIFSYKPLLLTCCLNDDMIKKMRGLWFKYPDDEWIRYVYVHRTGIGSPLDKDLDYVYGHMADGHIQEIIEDIRYKLKTYSDFKTGIFPQDAKVFYYNQLVFKSEFSLRALGKIEMEVL